MLTHTRRLRLQVALFLALLIAGCGSNFEDTISGQIEAPVPTANLQFQFVLARTIPTNVTDIRFTGRDSGGATVYGPVTRAKAATVLLENVPITVVTVFGELLDNGTVVGQFTLPVTLVQGETSTINDPEFTDVNNGGGGGGNARANGTYFGVAGTLSTTNGASGRESNIRGTISPDGAGSIPAGMGLTVVQHQGDTMGAQTGGTYSVGANDKATASVNSILNTVNITESKLYGNSGGAASFGAGVLSMDSGNTAGLALAVTPISAGSNASLNGTYVVGGFHNTLTLSQTVYSGTLTFDGSGGITGQLNDPDLATFFFLTNPIPLLSGTYTVAANGDFTATLDIDLFNNVELVGSVGTDGAIIFTDRFTNTYSGVGLMAPASTSSGAIEGTRELFVVDLDYDPASVSNPVVTDRGTSAGEIQIAANGDVTGNVTPPGGTASAVSGNLQVNGSGRVTGTLTVNGVNYTLSAADVGTGAFTGDSSVSVLGRVNNGSDTALIFIR